MGKFEVEQDVPMPDTNGGRNAKYPWADMAVGDSFFVDAGRANAAQSAMVKWGQSHNVKFTSRRVEGGMRIWRIA